MPNTQFGSGTAILTPNAGNLAANPTPILLKILQEASIEFKGDLKKLYGQKQLAVATARGKIDVTGKCKIASFNPNDINQIYWGQQTTVGGARPVALESHAFATTITPTVGSGLMVVADQGVINGDTGASMIRVATAPAVGQYEFTPATTGGSPTAAVYTFNAAETASTVKLNYTSTSTQGTTLTLANQAMGYAPVLTFFLFNYFHGKLFAVQLNSITLGMMSFPTKQEDFWVSDMDFSADCDDSDTLGFIYAD